MRNILYLFRVNKRNFGDILLAGVKSYHRHIDDCNVNVALLLIWKFPIFFLRGGAGGKEQVCLQSCIPFLLRGDQKVLPIYINA